MASHHANVNNFGPDAILARHRCPADSWRTAYARRRRLRAHSLASVGTSHPPAVADVADVSHESSRVAASMDFFTVPTLTGRVLFVVIVLSHLRRRIVHFNITEHPTAMWTAQQVVEAFPGDTAPKWLHRDRDRGY